MSEALKQAVDRLNQLTNDQDTPAAELAAELAAQREVVRIEAQRAARAQRDKSAAHAQELMQEAGALREQADKIQAQIEHARKTAFGTVVGLFGTAGENTLTANHVRPLKCLELQNEYSNMVDAAGLREGEARQLFNDNTTQSLEATVAAILSSFKVKA